MIAGVHAAAEGIRTQLELFSRAAAKVSRGKVDADLAREIQQMKLAKHGVKIQAKVIKVGDEMTESLIDILA